MFIKLFQKFSNRHCEYLMKLKKK